jgi:predicted transposase YdaD
MAGADISGKWLIGQSPEAWVQWILDDSGATVEEMLTTEFQHVSRLSDSLLRVKDQTETFLLLTELQLRPDEHMPRRMRAYAALAEEKYDLPVYPVVFYLLSPGNQDRSIPDQYAGEFRGLKAHQDFHVVKAWELKADDILARQNLALLPFVPLMQGVDEAIIRSSAQVLRRQPEGEKLETILALFASFVLSTEMIQQIVRWNMTVLRESPW